MSYNDDYVILQKYHEECINFFKRNIEKIMIDAKLSEEAKREQINYEQNEIRKIQDIMFQQETERQIEEYEKRYQMRFQNITRDVDYDDECNVSYGPDPDSEPEYESEYDSEPGSKKRLDPDLQYQGSSYKRPRLDNSYY
jgi:hypothetical protein